MGEGPDDILARLRARIASIEGAGDLMESHARTPSAHDCDRRTGNRRDGDTEPPSPALDARKGAERAFRKIERLSLVREQASVALHDRLLREGFSEDDVTRAIDRAVRCGLVDDLRFAEVLMRSRSAAGRGRQGIEAELSRLGIEASDVPGWPEEFVGSDDDEISRAIALLDRKPPKAKNLRDAAYRRLIQKGFSSSSSSSAARLWAEALLDQLQD